MRQVLKRGAFALSDQVMFPIAVPWWSVEAHRVEGNFVPSVHVGSGRLSVPEYAPSKQSQKTGRDSSIVSRSTTPMLSSLSKLSQ